LSRLNSSPAPFLLAASAGVLGAAGVALAAVAAHRVESPALVTAASMLMIHAVAGLAIAALAAASHASRRWCGLGGFMLGAVALFSGDIALNAMAGFHLFPMAAPTGGSLLIASWLAVAVCALLEWKNARREL
jgi:uncharacterized membrane protein YgdD (TMEM256/DUF423 family)